MNGQPEYRSTHNCPLFALAAFRVAEELEDILEEHLNVEEYEVYGKYLTMVTQVAYDRGYDDALHSSDVAMERVAVYDEGFADGKQHQSGLSVESFRERADALKRRAQENGHVHGWEDDGGAVPLRNIDRSFEDGALNEVRTVEHHKEAA